MTGRRADFTLKPCTFADLPRWENDDATCLLEPLRKCLDYVKKTKPYRVGSLGLLSDDLDAVVTTIPPVASTTPERARHFFETSFVPFMIQPSDGRRGFVTAFYEPVVEVSDRPDDVYCYPFYRPPVDLIEIADGNRPDGWPADYRFGRRTGEEISIYPDRRAIDSGLLEGRGLEIAWAKSSVDVFFAHVQGAAQLLFPDGQIRRITYAAKNGHPFIGIGRHLIDIGEIPESQISMQAIRAWLRDNPARVEEILWTNRSYIFFRESLVDDPALGPIAAAKVQLVPGRSLAVDREIHTFGFPIFVHAETITHIDDERPFARLMLAMDTGSAIVGPARGDIFTGSGDLAGEHAGAVRSAADFYILIPKDAASRYIP
ncbi:murein transglycosylase A [Ciceribacter sp. L1K22]|uniref:murein transglycosylase A n=1 Tax=Ciceribacter sp. L1K22 TaxID=2820275 RepID=UPI001ABECEA1|nr:murein transglycosylase A [Ciceribacter sp. L1K22]MBO3758279.1 murein transglycosylase A [Ciceribacter sp. L1K22]